MRRTEAGEEVCTESPDAEKKRFCLFLKIREGCLLLRGHLPSGHVSVANVLLLMCCECVPSVFYASEKRMRGHWQRWSEREKEKQRVYQER